MPARDAMPRAQYERRQCELLCRAMGIPVLEGRVCGGGPMRRTHR